MALTRYTLGFAMKATNIVKDGKDIPLFKDPKTDTDKTKKSAKGLLMVHKHEGELLLFNDVTRAMEETSELTTLFKDGVFYKHETLAEIRERVKL